MQYNAQGHTQKETNSQSTKSYQYNAAERLVRYEESRSGNNAGSSATQASYRYDPFGRRISKTTTQGGNSQTTYYAYSNSGLLAELNDQGIVTKAYGWNPQAAGLWSTAPLWQAQVGNNSLSSPSTGYHYLHTDHLETPVLGTDKSGTQTWRAIREAFGETKVDTASTITMNLRFAGQYYDEESGLHQNYFRDYRPRTGRYVQSDPIGLAGGVNTYAYGYGSPLSNSDPEGLIVPALAVWSLAGATAGAAWWAAQHPLQAPPSPVPEVKIPTSAITAIGRVNPMVPGIILICEGAKNRISDWMRSESSDSGAGSGDEGQSKPPPDTVPIDGTKWSGDHQSIKDQSLAGAADNTRVGPTGEVWVQRPDGSWVNTGNAHDMVGGSEASGRKGRDREPAWKQDRGRKQRGGW